MLPVHVPFWQVSVSVHALLSLQVVPFVTGVNTQPSEGSQESVVHGLLSLQMTGALTHAPPEHVPDITKHLLEVVQEAVVFWQLPVASQALHEPHVPSALPVLQQKPSVQVRPVTH